MHSFLLAAFLYLFFLFFFFICITPFLPDSFRSPLSHFHPVYPGTLRAHICDGYLRGGMWRRGAEGIPLGSIGGTDDLPAFAPTSGDFPFEAEYVGVSGDSCH